MVSVVFSSETPIHILKIGEGDDYNNLSLADYGVEVLSSFKIRVDRPVTTLAKEG